MKTPTGIVVPLLAEFHPVLGGQGVHLGDRPASVLREPSAVEQLHGPGLAVVVAPRFDALLIATVFANHQVSDRSPEASSNGALSGT